MPENTSVDLTINSASGGSVYFASDVIATIAGLALTEIEGITNIVRYNTKADKKSTLNIKNLTKGIKVDVKENVVSISITATLEYGYAVSEVCRNIQENVKKTVESMTGMEVKNVDVHVSGLNFDKENVLGSDADYRSALTSDQAKAISGKSEKKDNEE